MSSFQKGDKLIPSKLKRASFPLPELGDGKFITLRALSAKEISDRQAMEKSKRDKLLADNPDMPESEIVKRIANDEDSAGYALIAKCAVDEAGELLFSGAADAEASLDVAASSILGMVEMILDISGLKKDRSKN